MKSSPSTSPAQPSESRYGSSIAAVWFSATPSSIIFTLVATKRSPAALGSPMQQTFELLEVPGAVPPQSAHDGRLQCAVAVRAQVGRQRVGAVLVVADDRVLPAGDAQRDEVVLGGEQGRVPVVRSDDR